MRGFHWAMSVVCMCSALLLSGCSLFQTDDERTEHVEILATHQLQEEQAIKELFQRYATAMTTKDIDLFKSVFSKEHSSQYLEEVKSFHYVSRQCDMEMTVQSVKPYYLSDTEATVEVVLDTHYTYVPESKKDKIKDFRLTTRFHLLKIEDRWIIEYNIKKYIQKESLDEIKAAEALKALE